MFPPLEPLHSNMSRIAKGPQGPPKSPLDVSHVEGEIASLYDTYIVQKSAPLHELEKSLHTLFTNERFISMRTDVPKGLNALGSQLLESSSTLWLLCIGIKIVKTPTMKMLFPLLRSAVGTVGNRREFIERLDEILTIKDIEMTPEDGQNLDKLLHLDAAPNQPETMAVSECGKYAVVKLTNALQKKLGWTFAITPVEGNDWVSKDPSIPRKPLSILFSDANHSYHPGSSYKP